MAKYSITKAKINEKITTNTTQAITGNVLNEVLQTMVESLGADYQFGGLVQPGSTFTAGEQPVVFLATTPGTYTNFGGLVVADGEVALLVWSGTAWSKQTPDIATRTEVSQLGQELNDEYNTTKHELTSGTFVPKSSIVNGLIVSSDGGGVIKRNANFKIVFIKVLQGYKIKPTSVSDNPYTGFTATIPSYNVAVSDFAFYSSTDFVNTTIESAIDGYFCVAIPIAGTLSLSVVADGLAKNVELLEQQEKEVSEKLDYNLATESTFPDVQSKSGLIPTNNGIAANGNYTIDFYKVYKGQQVAFRTASSGYYTAFTKTEPARYVETYEYNVLPNAASALSANIIAPFDGYYCIGRNVDTIPQIELINHGLTAQIEDLGGTPKVDFESLLPNYIFGIYNDGDQFRQKVQVIGIENVVNKRVNLGFNFGKQFKLASFAPNASGIDVITKHIELTSQTKTLAEKDFNYIVSKASRLNGNLIKYLAIGDSWTFGGDANTKDLDGSIDAWNYTSEIVNESLKLKKDLAGQFDFIALGTRSADITRTLSYKDESYTLKAPQEGRGGWSTQSYLRHPVNVRQTGAGDLSGKAAWDACGLGRKEVYGNAYDESLPYSTFVDDIEHISEYLLTAMGYYHWDYSTELMNWCGIQGTYSGTAEQKSAIDDYMENLLTYPNNPFYDWDTARNSLGDYAFNFGRYLDRYKTREEDGITKLVRGETAGTRIIYQSQLDDYVVCTPTHISIELGINDYQGLDISQRASDIEQIASLIHSYSSAIKVGIATIHLPGCFFPEKFVDTFVGYDFPSYERQETVYITPLFNLNKAVCNNHSDPSQANNIFYIPTFFVQGFTRQGAIQVTDIHNHHIVIDGTNELHPPMDVYKQMAQQILAWVIYSI